MADAKTLEELSTATYWDNRYRKGTDGPTYEWFKTFANLEPLLSQHMPKPTDDGRKPRIIHLGCGNSTLPIDLYSIGYKNHVCVDFSEVVIANMASRYAEAEGIEWKVQDIRHMEDFNRGEFDVAIDKGTLDAFLSGSLWDPPEPVKKNTKSYIDEVARILKPGAVFIYITYRQPHFVKPLIIREGVWDLQVMELNDGPGTLGYFGFIMRKKK